MFGQGTFSESPFASEGGAIVPGIKPGVANLSLVGFAPAVAFTITPATGAINEVGVAPKTVLAVAITPNVASLAIATFVPGIARSSTANPGVRALSLSGQVPSVALGAAITPTGSSVIVGSAPVIAVTGITKVPGTASLNIVGNAPEIATQVFVPTGAINIASDQPLVSEGSFVNTVVGAASFVGHVPSLLNGVVSNPGSQSLAIVGSIPKTAFTITPDTGTLSIVGTTSGVRNPNWTNVNTSQTPNWELIAA